MLALSRRLGERIRIGEQATVKVESFDFADPLSVNLSIDTPQGTSTCKKAVGEALRIGQDVVVQVYKIHRNGRVHFGFDAPRSVQIDRLGRCEQDSFNRDPSEAAGGLHRLKSR